MDDDAFQMLCYHDNLWGACFPSSVLSDSASVYLHWRCKVSVVTTTVLTKQMR